MGFMCDGCERAPLLSRRVVGRPLSKRGCQEWYVRWTLARRLDLIETLRIPSRTWNTAKMPARTRPIDKLATAAAKCSKEVRMFSLKDDDD